MITYFIDLIQNTLLPLGAFGVFSASFIEEVIAPIPSALIMLTSGFVFLEGPFTLSLMGTLLFKIVVPVAFGVTLGSIVIYEIFFYGGKPVIEKWGKWLGLSWKDVEKAQKKLDSDYRDELIIFGLRVVPIFPNIAIGALCGTARYPFKKYVIATFFGAALRAVILGILGWEVGSLYIEYAEQIHIYENVFTITAAACILLFVGWKIYQRNV